jgi:hypothetical protein
VNNQVGWYILRESFFIKYSNDLFSDQIECILVISYETTVVVTTIGASIEIKEAGD